MNLASRVELGDGARMPWFGVGLYKVAPPEIEPLVDAALGLGHRLFDTATMYKNELALGSALSASGVPREDVFLTTKVLNADHGFDRTREACHESLDRLGTDYLDLYLIHWPAPTQNRFIETWEALVSLREEGLVRSIGVANFHVHHLDRLAERGLPAPVLNQVECHPWLPQEALRAWQADRGILTQAWSPLARGRLLVDPVIRGVAAAHGATPAQVLLAWQLSREVAVIPKTTGAHRLTENALAVDLVLTEADMLSIAHLESGVRTGADPDDRD